MPGPAYHGRTHAVKDSSGTYVSVGTDAIAGLADALNAIASGGSSVDIKFGSGTPEGSVTGNVGDVYIRSNGLTGTTVYDKTSGTGNTGWTAKVILGGGIVEGDFAFTDILTANVSTTKHGLVPKAPNSVDSWFRGDGTWAALGAKYAPWDAVLVKPSDESVTSSTTLQDDNDLVFTPSANAVYIYELALVYIGPATADLKFSLSGGGTSIGEFIVEGYNTADAMIATPFQHTTATAVGALVTDTRMVRIHGWFTTVSTTTFKLQWAQNSSNVVAMTVNAGSYLRYVRVV